ncbi:MAG TPA: glycosyl hydrolase [Luteolibacter sp.]|nr:glycosyl hydrolase [Luteolibacter sp.]
MLRQLFIILPFILPALGQELPLEARFKNPDPSTRPGCYWYWINDNISKEGITKDLEAMARVGIGRAYIGHIYNHDKPGDTPPGSVKFMSEAWWDAMRWTLKEADRCGVDLGFFNSPGWSQSGGPWVKTSQSMRYLASSETLIKGGSKVDTVLPLPEIKTHRTIGGHRPINVGEDFTAKDFQPVRVIAFQQPATEAKDFDMNLAKAACPTLKNLPVLFDASAATSLELKGRHVIDFTFEQEQSLQSLALTPVEASFPVLCRVEAVDASGQIKLLTEHREIRGHQGPLKADPLFIPFTPVSTKHLRLTFDADRPARFSSLKLSRRAAVSHHVRKQLGETSPATNPKWTAYQWPAQPEITPGSAIDPAQVIDLSSKVDAQGRLQWEAPAGDWVVVRTGMLPTGAMCAPASPEGQGLEADKMSKEHIRSHFDAFIGEFIRRIPAAERKALKYVIADSYETGPQNWTDQMVEKFQQRFGYSPVPYLPCLRGRVVGSPDISTRFLWDWRRLIAESIAYDYVGGLREVSHEHGLKLWLENYGHWGFPSEYLLYGSQADEVGAEFWESATIHGNIECRAAASSAHIYGRSEVFVEAFTSTRSFKQSPSDLKSALDWVYAAGPNHLILHVNIHQPDERKPGIIQWFGTAFNRHNTWFEQSKAFNDYARRCAVMLASGTPVNDLAYYIGEDSPVMTGPLDPAVPDGLDFDHINSDALIHRAKVVNGRIAIDNGPSYALLILPKLPTMRPEVAAAISKLVSDGASILGEEPSRSPSLSGFPGCDIQLAAITAPLWASTKNQDETLGYGSFGKGRVYTDASLDPVMKSLGIQPDLTVRSEKPLLCAAAGAGVIGRDDRGGIVFKHRSSPEGEIYFLSNTTNSAVDFTASFRISGRQPEFWNAVTGAIEPALAFTQKNGRTEIPLHLEASESLFVVFGKSIAADACGSAAANHPVTQEILILDQPWNVSFEGIGAPKPQSFATLVDWTQHPDVAMRNFSGKATYTTTFKVDAKDKGDGKPCLLDLGQVHSIATVTLNGQQVGTLWTQPWRIDISKHLKSGSNDLQIEVSNSWHNRLISEANLPADQRQAHVSQAYSAGPKPQPIASGLLGPVKMMK